MFVRFDEWHVLGNSLVIKDINNIKVFFDPQIEKCSSQPKIYQEMRTTVPETHDLQHKFQG